VAKELDRIITTGYYIFLTSDTSRSRGELQLEYSPSPSQQPQLPVSQPSSLEDPEVVPPQMREHPRILSRLESRNDHEVEVRNVELWNSEQISDFVRKLGFLDTEKEGGDKIKHFLHVNEVSGDAYSWGACSHMTGPRVNVRIYCFDAMLSTDSVQAARTVRTFEGAGPPGMHPSCGD